MTSQYDTATYPYQTMNGSQFGQLDMYNEMEEQRRKSKLEKVKIKNAEKTKRTLIILAVIVGAIVVFVIFVRRVIKSAKTSLGTGSASGSFDIPIVGKILEFALGVQNLPTPARKEAAQKALEGPMGMFKNPIGGGDAAKSLEQLKASEAAATAASNEPPMMSLASATPSLYSGMWSRGETSVPKIDMPTCVSMFNVSQKDKSELKLLEGAHAKLSQQSKGMTQRSTIISEETTSIVIMIYRLDCKACDNAAGFFSDQATLTTASYESVSASTSKVMFGRIEAKDVPLYLAPYLPPTVPSFIVYDAQLKKVSVTHTNGVADFSSTLDGLCKHLVRPLAK